MSDFSRSRTADLYVHDWPDGLPPAEVARIAAAVIPTIGALHSVIGRHGELRPAAITIGREIELASATGALDQTALLNYAAPETFSGRAGTQADVYALGCTLFELLAGRPPFEGSVTEIVNQHLYQAPDFPADLPARWREILNGCLRKEPAQRWDLARVLEKLPAMPARDARPQPVEEPAPATERPRRTARRARPAAAASSTPLDHELKRHLHTHRERWGDGHRWQLFTRTVAPLAKTHGLTERRLIKRAQQLLPQVLREYESDARIIEAVTKWVHQRRPGRWSAIEWANFLDTLDPPDEARCGALRDALFTRLFPRAPKVTRLLELGDGIGHTLVYSPFDHATVLGVIGAFTDRAPQPSVMGIWHSIRPVTAREAAALGLCSPTDADEPMRVPGTLAIEMLETFRQRFPAEALRWPDLHELNSLMGERDTDTKKPARRPQSRTPSSKLGGLLKVVAQAATQYAVETARTSQTRWVDGAALHGTQRRTVTLISPVPVHP